MDISKVEKILKVVKLVSFMPSGAGWVDSKDIVQWSGVSQATTYRYLIKMEKLKLIEVDKKTYRRGTKNRYKATQLGIEYLNDFRELEMIL